ncbi:hypothetical protein NYQ83_08065 [Afifella sp. JA880]|uniref:hypothetical protein n=1 Tax=Afifella sp. JA880 TaxID=2975280 RepID=UPI0021BAD58D|nr:hypothetical protein [Afifella sp. JA880]MCT8267225.1 hypothetical protein [Afifella sp. JA880]
MIYPYFSEIPALTKEAARLGLYILREAIEGFPEEDIRIFDVLRSNSFSIGDVPFQGDEPDILSARYQALVSEWQKLKEEYP